MTRTSKERPASAFVGGAVVGTLGGLVGLGGAEFRLPMLITLFRFSPLDAVILNKATTLVLVSAALLFRSQYVALDEVLAKSDAAINLLAGSLPGAWLGAGWAARMHTRTLRRSIGVLLALIAVVLLVGHGATSPEVFLQGWPLRIVGALVGLSIGIVASMLGVAGGELLIPALVLLFGVDIKVAGSLSLAVSLPTMVVAFARFGRDRTFPVLGRHRTFFIAMAIGSSVGALIGAAFLRFTTAAVLYPLLALILFLSAAKVWQAERSRPSA